MNINLAALQPCISHYQSVQNHHVLDQDVLEGSFFSQKEDAEDIQICLCTYVSFYHY